jgi:hypothetical protein
MQLRGILAFLLSASLALAAPQSAEIEALLGYLKNLDGAVFIRNGSEHTATEAAAHLRLKWEKQAGKIKTTEDFIALCSAKSSLSGQRYQIRLKDGQLRYADELLTEHLRQIREAKSDRQG